MDCFREVARESLSLEAAHRPTRVPLAGLFGVWLDGLGPLSDQCGPSEISAMLPLPAMSGHSLGYSRGVRRKRPSGAPRRLGCNG